MKDVIAKTNKAGATVLFVDGKRVSKATLSKQLADELTAHIAAQSFTLAQDDTKPYTIEIRAEYLVEDPNGYGHALIEAKIVATVDTVSEGLRIMATARRFAGFYQATIFTTRDYSLARDYRWFITLSGLKLFPDGKLIHIGSAYIYDDCLAEFADAVPEIREYGAACAVAKKLAAATKEAESRELDAWNRVSDARDTCDNAVAEHLQSLIA